jgi:hypothetical protein
MQFLDLFFALLMSPWTSDWNQDSDDLNKKSKKIITLVLKTLGVFLLGAFLGGLSYRLYSPHLFDPGILWLDWFLLLGYAALGGYFSPWKSVSMGISFVLGFNLVRLLTRMPAA